mgnify:FL=1
MKKMEDKMDTNKNEKEVIMQRPPKSPALAGILAFFFPFGVGPLYNGQFKKAVMFFLIFSGLVTLQTTGEGQPFLGLTLGAFYIYQIFEAIQTAKLINQQAAQSGTVPQTGNLEEVPEAVKSGSIFWGLILMALGAVLILANFEIIDYGTLFDFWPLVIIVIGIKLVVEFAAGKEKA